MSVAFAITYVFNPPQNLIAIIGTNPRTMEDEILVVRHTLAVLRLLAFYAVAIPCLFAACIFRIALVIDAIRPRPKLARSSRAACACTWSP
jgi:hypothetical protein